MRSLETNPSAPLTVTESLCLDQLTALQQSPKFILIHDRIASQGVAEETLVVTSNLLSRKESYYNVSVQVQLKVKEKLKNTEPTCLREPELPLISHKLKACRSEGTWNIWLYFYLLLVEFSIFIFTSCVWLWELWECHTDSSLQQHSRGLTYDQQLFLICEAVRSAHTHSGLLLCLSPQSQHIRITSECVSKCVCWWRWATVPALSW